MDSNAAYTQPGPQQNLAAPQVSEVHLPVLLMHAGIPAGRPCCLLAFSIFDLLLLNDCGWLSAALTAQLWLPKSLLAAVYCSYSCYSNSDRMAAAAAAVNHTHIHKMAANKHQLGCFA